jgi:hypothetical protein
MGVFGEPTVGRMGRCSQCGNHAEIRIYPNDNPQPICENCYKENQVLEQKIATKTDTVRQESQYTSTPQFVSGEPNSEREVYIRAICNKATDEWLTHFISEVVTKKVLIYDWRTIIRNERWFSLLDLRRFALEVDPNIDQPVPPKTVRIFEPSPKSKRGRPKKKTQPKEEQVNA